MVALDSTGYGALLGISTLHHTTDTLPDLDLKAILPLLNLIHVRKYQLFDMLSLALSSVMKLGCPWPLASLNFSAA